MFSFDVVYAIALVEDVPLLSFPFIYIYIYIYVYMYISELLISSEGGGMRDSNFKVMIFVS